MVNPYLALLEIGSCNHHQQEPSSAAARELPNAAVAPIEVDPIASCAPSLLPKSRVNGGARGPQIPRFCMESPAVDPVSMALIGLRHILIAGNDACWLRTPGIEARTTLCLSRHGDL